jgi:GNAT superfamily N-acetyltransferase
MDVRLALGKELPAAHARLSEEWGDLIIVRGEVYRFTECRILIAGEMDGLAAISGRDAPIAELVAINAFKRRQGVGSALLDAIVAQLRGQFHTLRLTTTNDNLDALRFYQRRGFRLTALRPGAVDEARRRKASIPTKGDYGIPIRDELDLTLPIAPLTTSSASI